MSIFKNYARYYDLLYTSKDYVKEAQFVHQLIQTYAPTTKSILDLGCGTGIHAILLAKDGYTLQGVDLSQEMLEQAEQRLSQEPAEIAGRLAFCQGDVRSLHLTQQFDAVVSLFHVASYQQTNQDLQAMFATVASHLEPGGVFIFDCWYGPAVLSDRPATRVKRLEDEVIQVTRIAEPVLYPNHNWVDVNYQILIRDKELGTVEELQETHRMRYLFQPEVNQFLMDAGLQPIAAKEWLTNQDPGFNTWGVYFVAQKR